MSPRSPTRRRKGAAVFAAFAVLALALAPAIAEARPGGRGSSGSRGSQTYTAPPSTQTAPGTASQFQRTETPRPSPGMNQAAPRPTPAPAGGFFSRNPLMAGLMGGLLGAGLFGLLSGHGLFGGLAGFAGFLGLLLQIGLIAGLVWLVVRLVRGRQQPAMAGGPQSFAREGGQGGTGGGMPGFGPRPLAGAAASGVATRPIEIGAADFQAFERALVDINAAWSRQDVDALAGLSTPEMTRYFSQDLQDLKARGWTNATRDVALEAGDLSQAWTENGQDFATVAMRFSMLDVTTDAAGKVVEGSLTERQTATELWTFTRQGNSPWLLSAIQQST
jgi:predicted lipid-binding transport protein (Tim44 family)